MLDLVIPLEYLTTTMEGSSVRVGFKHSFVELHHWEEFVWHSFGMLNHYFGREFGKC